MGGGIIVVGSINLDVVVLSPVIPGPGESVCAGDFQMVPGGKGANQAVAAKRLGNRTFLLGRIGVDHFGDLLFQNLESCGVESSLIKRTESAKTGVALIAVSYTHLRAHETRHDLVCRLLLEKKKNTKI